MSTLDLSKYELILRDDFDDGFNYYDGTTGIWSTDLPRKQLATNGPQSVFLDGHERTPDGELLGPTPINVENGILDIGAGILTEEQRGHVGDMLRDVNQGHLADQVKYYTGMVSTYDTWSQTYGYFEIEAKVPAGRGHWSAFWLTDAGEGWPPEIDIFEAYGKDFRGPRNKDYVFHNGVHFDTRDEDGNLTQSIDYENHFELDEDGNPEQPNNRDRHGREMAHFWHDVHADEEHNAEIYDEFFTYAAEWTPTEIIFYFGPTRETMVELYRTPVPEDIHSDMILIANDQISSFFGWNPLEEYYDETFDDDNSLQIESMSIYALNPRQTMTGEGDGAVIVDGDVQTRIFDTDGDDRIRPGEDLDFVHLSGGADQVFIERGRGNDVIDGFGADDKIIIEGWNLDGAHGALERLTQVGDDVWLTNGAYPKDPQTIIFRNTTVEQFTEDNFVVRWSETPNIWSDLRLNDNRLQDTDGDGVVTAAPEGSRITDANSSFSGGMTLVGSEFGEEYFVYRNGTTIVEEENGGVDTVYVNRDYTLNAHIENIFSVNNSHMDLTGNGMDNILGGGSGNNGLRGMGGDDLLRLNNGGNDTVYYGLGDGHDVITGFGTDDRIVLDHFTFASREDLEARIFAKDGDVIIDLGPDHSITIRGWSDLSTVVDAVEAGGGVTNVTEFGGGATYHRPTEGTDAEVEITPWVERPLVGEDPADDTNQEEPTDEDVPQDAPVEEDQNAGETPDEGDAPGEQPDPVGVRLGGSDDDLLIGTALDETLKGSLGEDTLQGRAGDDNINGGSGDDRLFGNNGDDAIIGGQGHDVISGGVGRDVLSGGAGADTFMFHHADGTDRDIISDFTEEDVIMLRGRDLDSVEQFGNNTLVTLDDGGEILLRRTDAQTITADDFIFA